MLEIQFAPIQGYTDAAYRRFHNEIYGGSIGCYFTPFVRLEKGCIRNKDLKDIHPENNNGVNVVPQIIVNSVDEFEILVDNITALDYKQIDINMGCPFPLQTNKRRGAGLLPHIEVVKSILNEVQRNTNVQFSLKMRLGLNDRKESFELLSIINDTPLRQVVIHPRVGCQQYKGSVDMEAFDYLFKNINHSVVYNGDLLTVDDIKYVEKIYPRLTRVMLGRGLLSRPSIAMEYVEDKKLSDDECKSMFMSFHDRLLNYYSDILQGDTQLLSKIKTIWDYQEPMVGHKVIKLIKKSSTMAKYMAAVSAIQ